MADNKTKQNKTKQTNKKLKKKKQKTEKKEAGKKVALTASTEVETTPAPAPLLHKTINMERTTPSTFHV